MISIQLIIISINLIISIIILSFAPPFIIPVIFVFIIFILLFVTFVIPVTSAICETKPELVRTVD